jgi:hypothetical protein
MRHATTRKLVQQSTPTDVTFVYDMPLLGYIRTSEDVLLQHRPYGEICFIIEGIILSG